MKAVKTMAPSAGRPTPFAVGELGATELSAIMRIAVVTSSATDVVQGAEEILDQIKTFLPYDGIALSVWNPLTRRHSAVAVRGFSEDVIDAIDGFWVPQDLILAQTRGGEQRPARWRDTPGYLDSRSVHEFLWPAGYHEGLGASLYDARGRYTGMLALDCESASVPSDAAREAIAAIQPMLAGFTDALRGALWLTSSLGQSHCSVLVSASGYVAPIPGRDPGPLLVAGSPLVADVVGMLAAHERQIGRFWWQDGDHSWHRVRVHAVPDGALVVTTRGELPYGLSMRELDVLTILAEGASNADIARRLFLAERTVANHVASVLAKLDVPARAAAAARAVTEGMLRRPTPGARAAGAPVLLPRQPAPVGRAGGVVARERRGPPPVTRERAPATRSGGSVS